MNEKEELEFCLGFNRGYVMYQCEPQLAKSLSQSLNTQTPYFTGFLFGSREVEKQQNIENEFQAIRQKSKDNEKNIEL